MDILSPEARSNLMRKVRQRHTKPEMILRRALHRLGFRYRLNVRSLPGSPDLVFPSRRCAIFVHGCFWHDHEGCRFATKPVTRSQFWAAKFRANRERDARNYVELQRQDWRVLVVWECALKRAEFERALTTITKWLKRQRGGRVYVIDAKTRR